MPSVVKITFRALCSTLLVLGLSAACTDEDSCEVMITDLRAEDGELVVVISEAEALSRANAEAWNLRRMTETARDAGHDISTLGEDPPPPTRARMPLIPLGSPSFTPAAPCREGTCVEASNGRAAFRFVRPTAKGTYRLRDLRATLCEHGTDCPSVDERSRGALCKYDVERCVDVEGTVVVEELVEPCGEGGCGAFVAEIAVVEGTVPQDPTLVGRTKLVSRDRILDLPCGGGGGGGVGCNCGGWMNPMH
jgi:hypothetical protein